MRALFLFLICTMAFGQITTTTITIPKLIDFKKITFEAEAGAESTFFDQTNDDQQDIAIVIPGAQIQYHYNPKLTFTASALYEEQEFELENLHGKIQINELFSTTVGKQVFSFSWEDTTMVSDPILLTLSEIKETMARFDFDYRFFHGEIIAFNGKSDRISENDSIKSWGAKLSLHAERHNWGVAATYSYLNNIADSSELVEFFRQNPLYRIVDAHHARINANYKKTKIMGEYMITGDHFRAEDLEGAFLGVFSSELSQSLGDKTQVGISFQRTYGGTYKLDLPKKRYSLAANFNFYGNTSLNLEFYHCSDESLVYYDQFGNRKYRKRKYAGGLAQLLISV